MISKRLAFEYLLGQLFSTKLNISHLPGLLKGVRINNISGYHVMDIVLKLYEIDPENYYEILVNMQIYPNLADIEIETLDLKQ